MLVSLHLPKTGGTSFVASLQQYFSNQLELDYSDKPIHSHYIFRNTKAFFMALHNGVSSIHAGSCIHGHFLPLKYRFVSAKNSPVRYVTWFRDPIERLASHYYFWRREVDMDTVGSLRKKMLKENWSLEEFCFSIEMRNFYSQFLWGFPLESFDFIGLTEYYKDDFSYFCKEFLQGGCFEVQSLNVNHQGQKQYILDEGMRVELEDFHAKDMRLYQRAVDLRGARL